MFLSIYGFGQQKIGLVLSGGGATGLSHIGVLKALEENNIQIDYITGTSAGALIGALYCVGMSPTEIEAYVLGDDFQLMATGSIKPSQHFLFREENPHSGMVSLSFSKDSLLAKSLPTNFTESSFLDFYMMKFLGVPSASMNNDFDSLFVPFRCVASDVANKKSMVFDSGELNQAIRASMTFPFFIKPIKIDGTLCFDGGLYNNFPADVIYETFSPDFIIGSNVSYNAEPPSEDDLIGQVTNMLVAKTDFSIPCDQGIIITPNSRLGTFAFDEAEVAIEDGYQSTMALIDSIKGLVTCYITAEELAKKRKEFKEKIVPLKVSSVSTQTGNEELRYTRLSLIKARKKEILSEEELEKRYFRLYATQQVDFIFPTLELKADSTYNFNMKVRKSKDFKVDVGGHISSRPVNTGYIGITYQTIGKVLTKTHAESYFGKFYGSTKVDFTLEFPAVYPISTSSYFVMNRWDYFRSFATFFEDVQPSFLVQNEIYGGLQMVQPFGNTVKSTIDVRLFSLEDEYYQTENFTNKDTADITGFQGVSGSWSFMKNSLNRKQFASSGHKVEFTARYTYGIENSIPGSTSFQNFITRRERMWMNLRLKYQSFLIDKPHFHLGLNGEVAYSNQAYFANYTATLLAMNAFSPIPDASTYFLPEYRAPQFIALGVNTVFTVGKKIELRLDGFLYQPIRQYVLSPFGSIEPSAYFVGESWMASASAIYHSFVGPVRATVNYFPQQENRLSFQFSYGYILFNNRAIR